LQTFGNVVLVHPAVPQNCFGSQAVPQTLQLEMSRSSRTHRGSQQEKPVPQLGGPLMLHEFPHTPVPHTFWSEHWLSARQGAQSWAAVHTPLGQVLPSLQPLTQRFSALQY
jgi:hypothetical protein